MKTYKTKVKIFTVQESQHMTANCLARNFDVEKNSVFLGTSLVYKFLEEHFDRNEFRKILMNKCKNNPIFSKKILCSDKATFYLIGYVYRPNVRYWYNLNPH